MSDKVAAFKALHIPGDPLVLYNIWDAGSARAVADAGARAIATGSYGVAEAQGFTDGEAFALDDALLNLSRILRITDLPVTLDMEAGYGSNPAEVGRSVAAARDVGAAGINIEDRMPGATELVPVVEQAERIAAAAASGLFVNARCDVYLGKKSDDLTSSLVDAVIERAKAYADAGASGLFVPFLGDHATIAAICNGSPLPLNILWAPGRGDRATLAALGVARISHGHGPWAASMRWLARQAEAVLAGGDPDYG